MKLTAPQIEMLHTLSKGALEPYGLQVGTCRALAKRKLAVACGKLYRITEMGRKEIQEKEERSRDANRA